MATGYANPAGIEAHMLHYAVEMRRHGFDTKIVVLNPLPERRHRFLEALERESIPIVSMSSVSRVRLRLAEAVSFLPWLAGSLRSRKRPTEMTNFVHWSGAREVLRELSRTIRREKPDLIHVFGRLDREAWPLLPAERTIYHEMMTGTVDSYWTEEDLAAFRDFAGRAARFFAPGNGVAENIRREFGIEREIDVVFTMCPDEVEWDAGDRRQETGGGKESDERCGDGGSRTERTEISGRDRSRSQPEGQRSLCSLRETSSSTVGELRFGVLCRLVEQKGIKYILEALRMYRDRHGTVDFTFAGQGDQESMIREYVAANALGDVKTLPVSSASEILKKIDVFVHPSLDDAMPVSIAEALMFGRPCIVCDVGGVADLVRDGEEGFVIEPRRADLIRDRMEQFRAMSEGELRLFRQRARARYEAVCTPERVSQAVLAHYRHILGG